MRRHKIQTGFDKFVTGVDKNKSFHVFSLDSRIFVFTIDFQVEYVGNTEFENHESK